MRRSRTLSLVVVLLLTASVASIPVTADHNDEVTVTGTVTGIDGTPADQAVVLIGEDSTLAKLSPDELRELADGDPQDVTVVSVGSDGRFNTTLNWRQVEAAVAVSDTGISALVNVRAENASLDLQLYEQRPQTVHVHLGAVAAEERRTDMYVNLVNNGDTTIETLSVQIGSLPDGWSLTEETTTGQYHPDNRTLTWGELAPGEEIDTTLVLTVPENASVGEYTVKFDAESDTHRIDTAPETVRVMPEETPGPTQTVTPGGDEDPATNDSESPPTTDTRTDGTPSTRTDQPVTTSTTGPGFGTVAAVMALVLASTLLVRRQ